MIRNKNYCLFVVCVTIFSTALAMTHEAYQARWDKLGFKESKNPITQNSVPMEIVDTNNFHADSKKRKMQGALISSRDIMDDDSSAYRRKFLQRNVELPRWDNEIPNAGL